jgi:hypothetical protein
VSFVSSLEIIYGRSATSGGQNSAPADPPRQVFASGANREMAHRKTVAPDEDLGNARPVAALPIGLIAQKAARRGPGDVGGALQVEFGLGERACRRRSPKTGPDAI